MKRVLSIVLAIMILATGCSFIGHKEDINGSEPIIPALVQDDDGDNAVTVQNIDDKAVTDTAASTSTASGASTSEATGLTSGVTSSELLIDNGAGEGLLTNAADTNSVLITLYYRNKGGLLVPVTRTVAKQEGLAKAALGGLIDEAVTREQLDYYGLYPVLPKGTKIKGMSIKNQVAIVDFSKEFLNFDSKEAEQLAIASVVYTLTGFKTVSNVTIRVEGKKVEQLSNGTSLTQMQNRSNTFINSNETVLKDGFVKYDAYFLSEESGKFNYFVPVSLQVQDDEASEIPVSLFAEMSKKPGNSYIFTSIPEGTKLLSFEKQNNLAVLDFSSQINNFGGSAKADSILNQIYYTINQINGINKVKILIDGKETVMTEGIEVADEKALPVTLNRYIDK